MRLLYIAILIDIVVAILLGQLISSQQVYVRNLLFSSIVSDREVPDEPTLDAKIALGFRDEAKPIQFGQYLDSDKIKRLRVIADRADVNDALIATSVTHELNQLADGTICGIESLGRVVQDTARGLGCCSDFSKAWIFYARYLGLRVREVNTMNHTTVEYQDRRSGRWQMVDPLHHLQIVDPSGQQLSQYSIRGQDLFSAFHIAQQLPGEPGFDPIRYAGYAPTQYATLMWRKGVNFLEIEDWDSRLRRLHLPKNVRQLILLIIGIQPGWLMLTTDTLAFYLRTLKALLVLAALLVGVLNLAALARVPMLLRRRRTPARAAPA